MAYVTKEDGIRDFNNHDASGFFKYIDKMIINSDYTLTRVPKDPANPGILDLNSTWKMMPAYVNGYVDAYNLKYHSQTPSTYAVTEAAKTNYTSVVSTALGAVDLSNAGVPTSDNTGIGGALLNGAAAGGVDNILTLDNRIAWYKKASNWIILIIIAGVAFWIWKKRRRK